MCHVDTPANVSQYVLHKQGTDTKALVSECVNVTSFSEDVWLHIILTHKHEFHHLMYSYRWYYN